MLANHSGHRVTGYQTVPTLVDEITEYTRYSFFPVDIWTLCLCFRRVVDWSHPQVLRPLVVDLSG